MFRISNIVEVHNVSRLKERMDQTNLKYLGSYVNSFTINELVHYNEDMQPYTCPVSMN